MDPWIATLASVAIVGAVSFVGALALGMPAVRSHRFLLILVAVAAGTLVGDAFFHILPEATVGWASHGLPTMGLWIVGGFLVFFTLEVGLRARHAHLEMVDNAEHIHVHADHGHPPAARIAPFAWTNLVGDAVHNFLDGAVIATSFLVDPAVGVATTIAVVVHEVPQELGDFAVLLRAGVPMPRALLLNFASALLALLGAVVVLALPVDTASIEHYGLPLIAGAFLYVAAADLVPELHHHSKGREAAIILLSFVVGLAIMYGVLRLEEAGAFGSAAEAVR